MKNQSVVTINSADKEIQTVSIEDLKGLSVSEQFELLEKCGYHRGMENFFNHTFVDEWRLVQDADEGGYVAEEYVDLLSTDKLTVPFVLKDRCGTVIDEYNFILIYYWDSDPARLIAQCWIRGGEKETALTMPLTETSAFDGFHFVADDPAEYILTTHDIKCFEERISFHFSDLTKIAALSNGRFALSTHVCDDGNAWSGFPVCGDGDENAYRRYILKHLSTGIDIDELYEVGKDDSITFSTREAAKAWADRIGLEINVEAA